MQKFSLFVVIDNLFKFIILFLFNLIWCYYFFKNSINSIIFSFFLSVSMVFLINFVSKKKNKKKAFDLKKQQHIEDTKNTFLLMTNEEVLDFFYKLISKNKQCQQHNNHILVNTNSFPIVVFPIFKVAELSADDVLSVCKQFKNRGLKRIIILCTHVSPKTTSIAMGLKTEVLVLDYAQTYQNFLEKYEFYPEIISKTKTNKKQTFQQILNISINKKRTKGYFLSALFLIFSSFFVPYKAYYLLFASILLILSFISRFNHKFNSAKTLNPLE